MFVQRVSNDDIIYAPIIYSTQEQGLYKYGIFAQGNGMIISKKLINVIINSDLNYYLTKYPLSIKENNLNQGYVDDGTIGYILCCYFIEQKENIFKHFYSYSRNIQNEKYENYITISYRDRENKNRSLEFSKCDEIHNYFIVNNIQENKDKLNLDIIDKIINEDKICLHIPGFINREISKSECINILKYNEDFQKIKYIY